MKLNKLSKISAIKDLKIILLSILLIFILYISFAFAIPLPSFVNPTPVNNTSTTNTSIIINTSIVESSIGNLTYNWDGTNYIIYDDSLVLMMNFDNRSSLGENATRVVDLSLYGNNGTVGNATASTRPFWNSSGKYSGAYQFDGVNDFIEINDSNNLRPNKFTIQSWIKITSTPIGYHPIVEKFYGSSPNKYASYYLAIGLAETGVWVGTTDDTWNKSVMSGYPSIGVWHYIVGTYNGTELLFYLDGILNSSVTVSKTIDYNSQSLYIGQWGFNQYFNGMIDEVRIWNRSLTASEIYEQYVSNLNKFNSTQWYFYVNQSKNSTNGLDPGNYSYQLFATNSSGSLNSTDLRNISILNVSYPNCTGDIATGNWIISTNQNISQNVICNIINVSSGTVNINAANVTLYANNLYIQSGGVLTHQNNTNNKSYLINLSVGNLTIYTGGIINVSRKGYSGTTSTGNGPGGGTGTTADVGGGGGGGAYGGNGGNPESSYRSGNYTGDIFYPFDLGSAGGAGYCGVGGSGGGLVIINASETIIINGRITADGSDSCYHSWGASGGGAGGGIYINAFNLSGNGNISANGGLSYVTGEEDGGSGSGGRIALYLINDEFTGLVSVSGGVGGYRNGGNGTIFKLNLPLSGINYSIDNQNLIVSNGSVVLRTKYWQNYSVNITRRVLDYWNLTFLRWNDSASPTITATYNISGLNSSSWYSVYYNNNEIGFSYSTDSAGNIQTLINTSIGSNSEILVSQGSAPVYPFINFISPTPINYFNTTNNSVEINVSIQKQSYVINEILYNWNSTNFTIYNDSLVLMYNFDNRSDLGENSTYVVDVSKYGNNGTTIGNAFVNLSSGKYSGGLQLNGSGDYINCGNSSSLNITGNITIAAWINTRNISQSWQSIVGKQTGVTGYYGLIIEGISQRPAIWLNVGSWSSKAISTENLTNNTWYYIVGTYNGTRANLYVNGILKNSTSLTGAIASSLSTPVYIGMNNNVYFNGMIDEARIWNRSLTASEIYEQYVSNLNKFNSTQWYFYVNQSLNSTNTLPIGNYSYQTFVKDIAGYSNQTEQRNISIIPFTWPRINLNWIYPTTHINVTQNEFFNISVNVTCLVNNCSDLNVTLDPIATANTVYNFTTCGKTGQTGPSQAECNTNYSGTSLDGLVNVWNGTQNWTVPATGIYTIKVAGAVGGLATSYASNPGRGAIISGRFSLTQGQVIKILVGQKGGDGTTYGGGGGGTYVVSSNNDPLIVAGGGGGPYASDDHRVAYSDANFSVNGRAGEGTSTGGVNGLGGSAGMSGNAGSGGGGFFSNGGDGYSTSSPGLSFLNLSIGGNSCGAPTAGSGGFGGGGGAEYCNYYSAGGGGGYSGGGGGGTSNTAGGGGGSVNNGTNQNNSIGLNSGNGYVEIQFLGYLKSGTVSMNSSTIGFYTNITNPYNLSLGVNESQVITWFVNATGSINIANEFFIYANLTENSSITNQSSKLNITIKDILSPIVNITYPLNITYYINVSSINYTYSDYNGNGRCWYSNNSGIWNSSSVSAGTNFTNITTINNYTNIFTVYCNDSSGNIGSVNISFTKRVPNILLDWIYPTTHINVSQNSSFNISVNISCINGNCEEINITLDPSANTVYNFTNCNATGRLGPTQTNCTNAYSGTTLTGLVTVSGNGTQNWTVPYSGPYNITAVGAAGGSATSYTSYPGRGAIISGTFDLTAGTVISIVVGQKGGNGTEAGGGGGASYVMYSGTTPLIVAGGGGGALTSSDNRLIGTDALANSTNSRNHQTVDSHSSWGGYGCGGGGGGVSSDGLGDYPAGQLRAGLAYINGSVGGLNGDSSTGVGGFGGGGSSQWHHSVSGGGGGYNHSLGGSGYGGGGGSFNNGTNQINLSAANNGTGYVTITFLGSPKGGTVSMNSSETPFYTNITNPYNLTLGEGQSSIITWWVFATGIIDIPYEFYVYANKILDWSNTNQTSKLNITIKDMTSPIVNITYPLNITYYINVSSINYTYSDYNGNGRCWYSNNSGIWNSSSVSAGTNFTNITSVNGTNTWTVYCNDSSGNIGSVNISFTKRVPNILLDWIYPTTHANVTQNEWFNITVNVSCINGNCEEINLTLDPIASGKVVVVWDSYSGADHTDGALNIVQKLATNISGTFNSSLSGSGTSTPTNELFWSQDIILLATSSDFNVTKVKNAVSNGKIVIATMFYFTNISRDLGLIKYNFTSPFATCTDPNSQIIQPYTLNYSCTSNGGMIIGDPTSDQSCTWEHGCQQYVANNWAYVINNNPCSVSVKGGVVSMNSSATPFYTNITNPYNLSLSEGESQSVTWWVNATGTTPNYPYEFYVYANKTNEQSNKNQTSKLNITIKDIVAPVINITYPLNNINYTFNISTITYNYSDYSGNGRCWYSNNSGIWNSSSVSAGSNITNAISIDGTNNWTLYCNDSSGNLANSSSVVFFRDATYPRFTNLWSNNVTMNGSGLAIFNVTIINTNLTVFLEINGTNYTANNISANVWNYSLILTNGTYSYRWISFGNFTLTNLNVSNTLNYTLYGNLRIVNVSTINQTGVIDGFVPQGRNVTINASVENAANILLKIWRTIIGAQVLWQGFMSNVIGNVWSVTVQTNTSWPVGDVNYTVFANDSLRYQINISGNISVLDTRVPEIYLKSPLNNSFVNNNTQYFVANFTENVGLVNATLYIWNSTNSTINITSVDLTGNANTTNISIIFPYEGIFKWNYYACDNSSNCIFNNTNLTITYDNTSPIVNITYPLNTTYNINTRFINYTYYDINSNASCWYSNDSGVNNYSIQNTGTNFTNVNSSEGSNTWIVYCNDTAGNINSSSVTFVKDTPTILLSRVSPADNINSTNVSLYDTFDVSVNVSCINGNCGEINITLDPTANTIYNFTTCNKSGNTGPNQTQCNLFYNGTNLQGLVTVGNSTNNSGIQYWTVPSTGTYSIETVGASGGYASSNGGYGAKIIGTFILTQGQVLKILVGQNGSYGTAGGGGGGSFVALSNNTPLIVAGGGGGAYGLGRNASTGTSGGNSSTYSGGVNGLGGNAGWGSGGGGGFYGNGSSGSYDYTKGIAFISNGSGGTGCSSGNGGFGGGGGSEWCTAGASGAGGGYSGGAGTDNGGGRVAGGGGSYNNGTNQTNSIRTVLGEGYVTITYLGGSSKGGTVSMTTGATPFYTITQNPYNLTLNEGESQIITWTVNATGTANTSYEFFAYVNKTEEPSYSNITSKWNVTILNTTTDRSAPTVSLISPANASGSIDATQYFVANFTEINLIVNATLYIWNSSNSMVNTSFNSITGSFNSTNISIILPYNNRFKWNYHSCDNSSNCGFTTSNFTFTYDNIAPYFITASDITITNNQSLNSTINASDNVLFDSFSINWTGNFTINKTTGLLRNSSRLSIGNYYINITINDSLNNLNSTVILVNVVNASDSTYPIFSDYNITPENNTQYSQNRFYQFNVSILNTNGTAGIEFNRTNYTMSNVSSVFNKTFYNLAGGTYMYYFWSFGNGTTKLFNKTSNFYYTISQNTSAVVYLYINNIRANASVYNEDSFLINATLFNATGIIRLYKNGTLINSGSNSISNLTSFNSSGIYNITAIYLSNENYTGTSETWYINSSAAPQGAIANIEWVYPTTNVNVSQNQFFNLSFNVSCSNGDCQGTNASLNLNTGCTGTASYITPSGSENCSSIKSSTYTCSKSHDSSTSTGWFSSTQSSPENIYWDLGSAKCISGIKVYPALTYNNQIVNIDVSNDLVTWTRILSSWTIVNGGAWNENISFNEASGRYLRLNFTTTPSYASVSEIQIKTRNQLKGLITSNISASPFHTNISNPYNLILSEGQSQIITWFVNATGTLNTAYDVIAYTNRTSNLSRGNQTSSLNINILDTTAPIVNITYPLNTTYSSNISSLNYTYSDYNGNGKCWYSNNSGLWNSSSVSAGTNFTNAISIDGTNNWTLYCNDSSGNINSTRVVFSKIINRIGINIIYPTTNVNVSQNQFFNVSVNVSCLNGNCQEINVNLDPAGSRKYCNVQGSASSTGIACVGKNEDSTDGVMDSCTDGSDNNYMNVNNVIIDSTSYSYGDNITATCTICCYSSSTNYGISYNNGSGWVSKKTGTCSGGSGSASCTSFQNFSTTFIVNNVTGKHYIRCSEAWSGTTGTCNTGTYSDNDDLSFNVSSSSKGLISTITGATPFYTNVSNPYNITLNVNESQIITWFVNATGTANSQYDFFAYANKVSNTDITNTTSIWKVTIVNGSVVVDNVYPIFSNYSDNNGLQTRLGIGYFNVTVNNTNGTVWLSINNTNISATNLTSNVYNVSYNFTSIGNYNYTWHAYGNGNLTNLNNSLVRTYNVSIGDSTAPRITIISPLNITYRNNSINFNISINENASWCGFSLDNSVNITMALNASLRGSNYTNTTMSEGSHTIIFSCNDTSNNINSTTRIFVIDTIAPYINFVSPLNTSYTTKTLLISIINNSDARNIWFNRGLGNETYTTSISKTFSEGGNVIYAYANDSAGNLNSTNITFSIDSTPPSITVNSPIEQTYTTNMISLNVSTNENTYCWFVLNSSNNYTLQTINNRNFNYTLNLSGILSQTYSTTYYCNDSLNNLATKTVLFGIKIVPPQITLNSPASNIYYRNSTVLFNYTPMASNGLSTCELWGNWTGIWHKNDSTTSLTNYSSNYFTKTLNDGMYVWNIWCNNTLAESDWSTQGNITFKIDRTSPQISFISPLNISYNNSIVNVELINNSDANYVWWNNGTSNLTYYSSVDFNLNDGRYTFTAYANDSAGNINSTNISFNVDTSLPVFYNFINNNATLIGTGIGLFNISVNSTNGTVILNINNTLIVARNISSNVYNASYNFSLEGVYEYYWSSYSNGTSHLQGISDIKHYTVNNTDIISPNATLISPVDATYSNTSSNNFTANLSDITSEIGDTESGIKNATLNVYNSTNSSNILVNRTTVSYSQGTLESTVGIVVALSNGIYNWFYNIFDYAGNSFTSENRTITIDAIPPVIQVVDPVTNASTNNNSIKIEYTVLDTNLHSCWYDDEGYSSNNILSNCINITNTLWTDGEHNITIYANDSSGNINSSLLRIVIDTVSPEPNLTSPENGYSNDSLETTNITFNCSATDNNGLGNISLYITNSLNQSFSLNQTKSVSGLSNYSNWTLALIYGDYTWSCFAHDAVGNIKAADTNRSLILNFSDFDLDHIKDSLDNVKGREINVNKSGIDNLNISINGNSTYGTYNDTKEIVFYDSSDKIINFTHNFSVSSLDLRQITIIKSTNSIIVNLSGQIQSNYNKNVYINDNDFVDLCVRDAETSSISEITDGCEDDIGGEINFSTCLGNNTGVTIRGLTCVDEGTIIRIENLTHSAIKGTPRVIETPTTETPAASGGGGGGGIVKNKTDECKKNEDCRNDQYCYDSKCYSKECTDNSQCTDNKYCFEFRCTKLFDIKILEIDSPIDSGSFIHFTYLLKAMAKINNDVIVEFWLEKDGKKMPAGKDTIFIGDMEEKTERASIFAPGDLDPGVYDFYISVSYEKYTAKSFRQIEIDSEGNIFSVSSPVNKSLLYIVPLLLIIIILLLIIIIKLHKKKIKEFFEYQEEWALSYKFFSTILGICFASFIGIISLGFLGVIDLPGINDYIENTKSFVKYLISSYLFIIIGTIIIILIIKFLNRNKKRIYVYNHKGKLVPKRKNYLESILKSLKHKLSQKKIKEKVRILEKEGYDVDVIKETNHNKKIKEWKKEGYDVEPISKKINHGISKVKEWAKKGYDVDVIGRNIQKNKVNEWKKRGYDVDMIERNNVSKNKKIEEWKRRGYDVGLFKR